VFALKWGYQLFHVEKWMKLPLKRIKNGPKGSHWEIHHKNNFSADKDPASRAADLEAVEIVGIFGSG
jgi:hypothetical protein